ncbi:MAG: formate--tetrahydrofolate ligase [Chloroflexi bacterium]|nr:formate--tetrahydrofolate ligase [Chloroflexota bacterium]
MQPITEIIKPLGLSSDDLIPYGKFKAKIPLSNFSNPTKKGKLIVVTGITPTPAGEGKTTTAIGITQGMGLLGKNVIATLREPSLGPIFGIKGGGSGGGLSKVEPEDEINIHFTGDAHAVGSAHNLLSALTDNIAQRGKLEDFSPSGITWRRVTDVEDRALRDIMTGIGGKNNAPIRQTGFDIVTASEIMAILALSSNLEDLRYRLGKIIVGFDKKGTPINANQIEAVGSMMALLRQAINPNIVQTSEGQPVIVHTGPFGNIAHGCSSVVGDTLALHLSDYVFTEAGFGADLGFEKFMHIKSRFNNLEPSAAVIVASVRAVKSHGGVKTKELEIPNEKATINGMPNLIHLIKVIKSFGLPAIVAINKFPTDTKEELSVLKNLSEDNGAFAAVESDAFQEGGKGTIDLSESIIKATNKEHPKINYLYENNMSIKEKVNNLAKIVYNANGVKWSSQAEKRIKEYEAYGWGGLPICMAKTHLSLSHDRSKKGLPKDYIFEISDVRASIGAGFIYPIAGNIVTMPGLPGNPRKLDTNNNSEIIGL